MTVRKRNMVLAAGLAVVTAACSVFGGKAAEEVPYTVVRTDGDFEIRDYGPVVVARTSAAGGFDGSTNESFGRLFDYISGANGGEREIAMTSPVYREAEGTEISMTAPVFREGGDAGMAMEFALPAGTTLETAPVPTNPAVELVEHPPVRMAVLTYSGSSGAEKAATMTEALLGRVEAEGLTPTGPVRAAGYNPPWTIPALRRNEVMVAVE